MGTYHLSGSIRMVMRPNEPLNTWEDQNKAYMGLTDKLDDSRLITESVSLSAIEEAHNPDTGDNLVTEAVSFQYSRRDKMIRYIRNQIAKQLQGSEIEPGEAVIGKPRKNGTVATVTVEFPMSDGQSVFAIFYAPDDDPLKITAQDVVIAFRWLLNKRDITHVIAPEGGKELSMEHGALLIANLVEKNHPQFVKKQTQVKAQQAELDNSKAEIEAAQKANDALEVKIEEAAAEEAQIERKAKRMDTNIGKKQAAIQELQAQLDELKAQTPSVDDETTEIDEQGGQVSTEDDKLSPETIARLVAKAETIPAADLARIMAEGFPFNDIPESKEDMVTFTGEWLAIGGREENADAIALIDGYVAQSEPDPMSETETRSERENTPSPRPEAAKILDKLLAGGEDDDLEAFDAKLDQAAEALEEAGLMDEYDQLLNDAADRLSELLAKAQQEAA